MKTKFDEVSEKYYVGKPHFRAKWATPILFYLPVLLGILTFVWPEPFFDFVLWSRLYHFSPVKFFDNGARLLEISVIVFGEGRAKSFFAMYVFTSYLFIVNFLSVLFLEISKRAHIFLKNNIALACFGIAFSGFALHALYFGGYESYVRPMRSWARDSYSEAATLSHVALGAHALLILTACGVPLMLLVSFKIIRQWTLGVDHEGRPLGPDK
ncbi:hypothetical protein SAMN02983003_3818 [Devosia enhydra]|uniref:Uncharacterized protein n=1 Tax=Devosia enhydra TaxID=665118 RepID=A0A1K2I324_9HYPH|nr:hypothetical protein [Devosia enhydra]SFZ86627.1 hypothetical protein SAMN02983003_3818 [Devosia enhydra]